MKKIYFIVLVLFGLSLHAYEVGDKIDDSIASKIGLCEGVTVVDFFASWCVSCKKELPIVNTLSKEFDETKVKFVGIDTDKNVDDGLAFQKKLGLEFFVFNDKDREVVEKFNPMGMPAIYYIKDKKVLRVLFGAVDNIDEIIKKDIETLR